MLSRVQVVVAAFERIELAMRAAFDNSSAFDDQNLIGATDGGEPVSDHEGRSPLHQLVQSGLNHGLGLGVEGTGGLVENQDAGLCQQRASDRETLPLAAGELYATLADDGVVAVAESSTRAVLQAKRKSS